LQFIKGCIDKTGFNGNNCRIQAEITFKRGNQFWSESGGSNPDYADAGAAGLSVLTDYEYFGGTLANLLKAREANPEIPVLRKDFMIDPWQVLKPKLMAPMSSCLLLPASKRNRLNYWQKKLRAWVWKCLWKYITAEELNKVNEFVDIVGVNNRNLKTFEVDVETSVKLAELIPEGT
jgi:indole-3-glycerol phosphate synthase